MKVAQFIEKSFNDLTADDIKTMRRGPKAIPLETFIDHYVVSKEEYGAKIVELGVFITREDRVACKIPYKNDHAPTGRPSACVKKILKISRVEMTAIRMFRGITIKDMASRLKVTDSMLYSTEKGYIRCSEYLKQRYIVLLGIKESELKRIRSALSGEVSRIEVDREIPDFIRKEVYAKYGGKCAECSSKKKLHIHHKKKFSKGGLHELDNLILLCAHCHAETHKNDKEYYLLKSIAERIRSGVIT